MVELILTGVSIKGENIWGEQVSNFKFFNLYRHVRSEISGRGKAAKKE